MKKAILFILFIYTPQLLSAQASGPMISFDTETFDYGEITKGSDGVRTFTFENTGDAPLEIQGVRSSCGCTIPKKPEEPILPGQTGQIEVKYDTNRAAGPFRKAITVSSNANSPTKILKIKGELVEE